MAKNKTEEKKEKLTDEQKIVKWHNEFIDNQIVPEGLSLTISAMVKYVAEYHESKINEWKEFCNNNLKEVIITKIYDKGVEIDTKIKPKYDDTAIRKKFRADYFGAKEETPVAKPRKRTANELADLMGISI